MTAYIFPGQGSQFTGMGKDIYDQRAEARALFEKANEILGFRISDIMFTGTAEDQKQTRVTQPAVFIHSTVLVLTGTQSDPDMVAGHSLGEFSALVANRCLAFEDGLRLVFKRAMAMQRACDERPSAMAAILGLDDAVVEDVCRSISDDIVVPANYNCPGQLVISGSVTGVERACQVLRERGARRALLLPVGGAFHSPLMASAEKELAEAIGKTGFSTPVCPVYQNATAWPATDVGVIKKNLIAQLTGPVRWTQSIQHMAQAGAVNFIECGPGKVLQGLVRKIAPEASAASL